MDEYHALWSISHLSPSPLELLKQPLSREQTQFILQEALEQGDIPKPFATYVKATDPSTLLILNASGKQPFPHDLERDGMNVVFVGDANHAVSPFAGNGANMALMDGWQL